MMFYLGLLIIWTTEVSSNKIIRYIYNDLSHYGSFGYLKEQVENV